MASRAIQAGVLTVLFEYAKDLDNVKYPLPQNPFCIISIGDEEEETNPREDSKTTPVWFETRTLNVKNETKFSVEVHHYSDGDGESKFIGGGEGDLTLVRAQGWDREQQVSRGPCTEGDHTIRFWLIGCHLSALRLSLFVWWTSCAFCLVSLTCGISPSRLWALNAFLQ